MCPILFCFSCLNSNLHFFTQNPPLEHSPMKRGQFWVMSATPLVHQITCLGGMPCTQCEVLDVGKYSNPSFGPFSQVFVLVPYQGFFGFPSI